MSATNTNLTVGGAYNGHQGVVTVPSSLLFGLASTPGSINSLIQAYLGSVGDSLIGGNANFENNDLAKGQDFVAAGSVTAVTFEEFTDTDSVGGVKNANGAHTYSAAVSNLVTDLLVQVPGSVTLSGVGSTTKAVFGAKSNVTYSVTDAKPGEIDLLGGANSVTLFSTTSTGQETIYSAGSDTIDLQGQGNDNVSVLGNAVIKDEAANATVMALGSATTNLYFDNQNAGGTLDFINNSSVAATIHISVFTDGQGVAHTASTHVTAFGGVGGGYFVGGSSGSNSLVGGTGAVTLVGAGPGDFLEANGNVQNGTTVPGTNILYAGSGNSTLEASSATGANAFFAGVQYPGLGVPQAGGVISTDGSGAQSFTLGNAAGSTPLGENIYGSTVTGSSNTYFLINNASLAGGVYSIYNFVDNTSVILLENGSGGAGASITGAAVNALNKTEYDIGLSDGTVIQLKGLTTTQIANISTASLFSQHINAIIG